MTDDEFRDEKGRFLPGNPGRPPSDGAQRMKEALEPYTEGLAMCLVQVAIGIWSKDDDGAPLFIPPARSPQVRAMAAAMALDRIAGKPAVAVRVENQAGETLRDILDREHKAREAEQAELAVKSANPPTSH